MTWVHAGHERVMCSCGVVISQCRCNDPRKPVRVVKSCPSCTPQTVAIDVNDPAALRQRIDALEECIAKLMRRVQRLEDDTARIW